MERFFLILKVLIIAIVTLFRPPLTSAAAICFQFFFCTTCITLESNALFWLSMNDPDRLIQRGFIAAQPTSRKVHKVV